MNYEKIYNQLIEKAKHRKDISEYSEIHHILPKCMGGCDNKHNLVQLTAREHFVAHMLLVKIYPNNASLLYAANMMYCGIKRNNKTYAWFREKFSTLQSINQTGVNNNQYGKVWIVNENTKQCKLVYPEQISEHIEAGWKKGRTVVWNKNIKIRKCKRCGQSLCVMPNICKKRQMINTLIKYFGFDNNCLGSPAVYTEYKRVVDLLTEEYYINKLSTIDITKKYNISSTQHLDSIFSSLGIQPRTLKEAARIKRLI